MTELIKTALVTGGSRGIGKAIAKALAADGLQVYLTYVSRPEEAAAVAADIAAAGGKARQFRLDVSDRAAVAQFFADEIKDKVFLHTLVNNAGMTKDGLILRMKDEDWDRVLDVDLTGPFACLREAAKIMAKQRFGRIVNLSSVVGQMGNAGQANYVAAKAGLIGLTKTAARELGGKGVTVNAVAPGMVLTEMAKKLPEEYLQKALDETVLKELAAPEDIANAVLFLLSDAARMITGEVIRVDSGQYI